MSNDNTIGCINFGFSEHAGWYEDPFDKRIKPIRHVAGMDESVEEIIARLYGLIETLRETLAAAVAENNRLLEELRKRPAKNTD